MARRVSLTEFFGSAGEFPVRTGLRQGVLREPKLPDPPPWWPPTGTLPEWHIYWAHNQLGLKEEDGDFRYLFNLSAAFAASGKTQIDFMDFDVGIAIEIQGLFWHYVGIGGFKVGNDLERKINIEALGITLIYIDEDHANTDPIYYLKEARAGRDWSRAARGAI